MANNCRELVSHIERVFLTHGSLTMYPCSRVHIETRIPDHVPKIVRRRNGFLAEYRSYNTVAINPARPPDIIASTAALRHLYSLPPQLIPTRNTVELTTMSADPIQSTDESVSAVFFFSISYRNRRGTANRPTPQNGRLI